MIRHNVDFVMGKRPQDTRYYRKHFLVAWSEGSTFIVKLLAEKIKCLTFLCWNSRFPVPSIWRWGVRVSASSGKPFFFFPLPRKIMKIKEGSWGRLRPPFRGDASDWMRETFQENWFSFEMTSTELKTSMALAKDRYGQKFLKENYSHFIIFLF